MITELILNSTLLITLAVLFSFISRGRASNDARQQILSGLLFGGIAVVGMNVPVSFPSGIIYDGRSIILSMAGLFGGYISGATAMLIAGAYRLFLGGDGVYAGTASIITSVGIGLIFRYVHQNKPQQIKAATLFLLGVVNHIAMICCQLLLPSSYALEVISQIWLPVMLIFPVATTFMGLIFRNEKQRINAELEIQKNEIRYRTTLVSIGDGVITTDNKGIVTFINPMASKLTGWSESDAIGKPADAIFKMVNENTREEISSPVEKVLEQGLAIGLTNHSLLVTKDGTTIPITDSGAPIMDSAGKITGVVLVFKDQTEERTIKKQLVESERLFHTLTEKSPVGIFRATADGYRTYVNPKWCEISGLDFKEALGTGWLKAVHPEDREKITGSLLDVINKHQQTTIEYRFLKPDGSENWVLCVAVPELSYDGNFCGYIGTIIDITKPKLAQQELIRSHENFRRTMDQSPLGMRIVTDTGETSYVNAAFLDLHGYTNAEEFYRTPVSQRYTPESLQEHMLRIERRKKNLNEESDYEVEIITKTGKIRNLMVKRKMIFWDNQLQHLAIYQDFTERKQAERRLQLFGRATDQSPVSILITNEKGEIMYTNPKFAEVSGYSLAEVEGETLSFLKSGEHTNEFYADLWKTILNGEEWHGEFLNKRKNGELFWEKAVISSIVDDKGQITHFVAVKEDITEKKMIISDLKLAKEKAEESDRLKSAFLANMSHEIRTPLNAIIGFSNILVDNEDLSRQDKKEFASIMNQSAENLVQVINDILDISKIETGQLRMYPSDFDACVVVQELFTTTAQQLKKFDKTNIKFNYQLPKETIIVRADKVRFSQVFNNLLGNAIKFTNEGEISFGIRTIDSTHVTFFVSDTGIGVSPEQQYSIFEPFRQLDDTLTRAYEGAGLGLSISKKLIMQMGGNIYLESTPGKGSTFTFTIPLN